VTDSCEFVRTAALSLQHDPDRPEELLKVNAAAAAFSLGHASQPPENLIGTPPMSLNYKRIGFANKSQPPPRARNQRRLRAMRIIMERGRPSSPTVLARDQSGDEAVPAPVLCHNSADADSEQALTSAHCSVVALAVECSAERFY